MRAEQQPQVDNWLAQCNPMTASGSFLQVSGLQLQAGVGGEGDQGERHGIHGSASFPQPNGALNEALLPRPDLNWGVEMLRDAPWGVPRAGPRNRDSVLWKDRGGTLGPGRMIFGSESLAAGALRGAWGAGNGSARRPMTSHAR